MTDRLIDPLYRVTDILGTPLSGAKLYVYEAGTSTPINTYSDSALSSANTNPVVSDSGGYFGDLFVAADDYKMILKDAADNTLRSPDDFNISSAASFSGGISAAGETVRLINAQTGTSYTYLDGDRAKLLTHSNGSSIASGLPQANASTFEAGWYMYVSNVGVGTLTITPATSTINGASTYVLTTGQSVQVVSDGTNYKTISMSQLPNPASGDATKLLKVNAGETGYELGAKLPDFTSSKQGALAIQNAADDGFGFLTTQGTAGDPLLSGGADADPAFTAIATFAASVAALNYPVGSLYFNATNSTNPATLLGFGTWSAITDKFIIGASGTYSAGSTGGAATHTLTAAEIPDLTYAIATNTGGASGGSAARLGDTGTTATTADGSATSAITTNAGGGAHSILNPYLAAYVWQRTA